MSILQARTYPQVLKIKAHDAHDAHVRGTLESLGGPKELVDQKTNVPQRPTNRGHTTIHKAGAGQKIALRELHSYTL